jgi:putative endonuclease
VAKHNELGNRGEEIALRYLSERSYEILEKNWRYGRLEVDIIARLEDELIIAEVKTRTGNFMEYPQDAVTRKKQARLINAANAYIYKFSLNINVRFAIITVIFDNHAPFRVDHIENAFYPLVRN